MSSRRAVRKVDARPSAISQDALTTRKSGPAKRVLSKQLGTLEQKGKRLKGKHPDHQMPTNGPKSKDAEAIQREVHQIVEEVNKRTASMTPEEIHEELVQFLRKTGEKVKNPVSPLDWL